VAEKPWNSRQEPTLRCECDFITTHPRSREPFRPAVPNTCILETHVPLDADCDYCPSSSRGPPSNLIIAGSREKFSNAELCTTTLFLPSAVLKERHSNGDFGVYKNFHSSMKFYPSFDLTIGLLFSGTGFCKDFPM